MVEAAAVQATLNQLAKMLAQLGNDDVIVQPAPRCAEAVTALARAVSGSRNRALQETNVVEEPASKKLVARPGRALTGARAWMEAKREPALTPTPAGSMLESRQPRNPAVLKAKQVQQLHP